MFFYLGIKKKKKRFYLEITHLFTIYVREFRK